MELVEQLSRDPSWQQRDEIEWLVLERPGAALLQHFEGVETVCIVDALDSDSHEGVVRLELEQLLAESSALSSHNIGVAETLKLGAALKQLPPRVLLYGIVESPQVYEELSAALFSDLT